MAERIFFYIALKYSQSANQPAGHYGIELIFICHATMKYNTNNSVQFLYLPSCCFVFLSLCRCCSVFKNYNLCKVFSCFSRVFVCMLTEYTKFVYKAQYRIWYYYTTIFSFSFFFLAFSVQYFVLCIFLYTKIALWCGFIHTAKNRNTNKTKRNERMKKKNI